jgi:hypothetical protein
MKLRIVKLPRSIVVPSTMTKLATPFDLIFELTLIGVRLESHFTSVGFSASWQNLSHRNDEQL